MTNTIKKIVKSIKNFVKNIFLKEELNNLSNVHKTFASKLIEIESRTIILEKDNEELKFALGNLSIAYLEIMKSIALNSSNYDLKNSSEEEKINNLLMMFNYKHNDDDLIN